jgi:hypothetical protein
MTCSLFLSENVFTLSIGPCYSFFPSSWYCCLPANAADLPDSAQKSWPGQ